jgi:hypothetical protein
MGQFPTQKIRERPKAVNQKVADAARIRHALPRDRAPLDLWGKARFPASHRQQKERRRVSPVLRFPVTKAELWQTDTATKAGYPKPTLR